MIEDYDEVNHFIHNKIEKYNEKFAEFKRNLDVQDHKIKKECRKKIGKEIKKNPKKMAQKFIDLARNNDDTTEETEYSENETKKIFKHSLKGGMVDDDYSDNIQIDETVIPVSLDVDEINETEVNTAPTVGGQTLKFSDIDKMIDENKKEEQVTAPKTIERLESISNQRNESRKLEEMSNMDDDDEKIKIFDESVQVAFEDLGAPNKNADDDLIVLDGIEIL